MTLLNKLQPAVLREARAVMSFVFGAFAGP